MTPFKTTALIAICAGGAMLISTLPAQADHLSVNAGVNMIYPPKKAKADLKLPGKEVPKTETQTNIRIYLSSARYRYLSRREFVDRALFQNYSGFKKVYRGRRYPF